MKYARTAFNRKILGSEKLTDVDKNIIWMRGTGSITFGTFLMGGTIFILKKSRLRRFPLLKYAVGGATLFYIFKSMSEIPIRMAFADYMVQ